MDSQNPQPTFEATVTGYYEEDEYAFLQTLDPRKERDLIITNDGKGDMVRREYLLSDEQEHFLELDGTINR